MKNKGFTIVELLISLAIMAMLMAAVSAAIHASFQNFSENDQIADVTQTARSVMGRMCDDIRVADAVSSSSSQVTILLPSSYLPLTQVQYELSNGALYMRRTSGGVTTSYPLLDSTGTVALDTFALSQVMGKDWQGLDCTKSVTARLTMTFGGQKQFSMTATAAPRRNQLF